MHKDFITMCERYKEIALHLEKAHDEMKQLHKDDMTEAEWEQIKSLLSSFKNGVRNCKIALKQ